MRAVFLKMLLPTVVILKHTKKEFIWRAISAYFGGLIAFQKKKQRPTLAQKIRYRNVPCRTGSAAETSSGCL